MAKVDVIDIRRQKIAEMEVDDGLLKAPERSHLIYDVVRCQLASRRSGTASTKERSFISGGGRDRSIDHDVILRILREILSRLSEAKLFMNIRCLFFTEFPQ